MSPSAVHLEDWGFLQRSLTAGDVQAFRQASTCPCGNLQLSSCCCAKMTRVACPHALPSSVVPAILLLQWHLPKLPAHQPPKSDSAQPQADIQLHTGSAEAAEPLAEAPKASSTTSGSPSSSGSSAASPPASKGKKGKRRGKNAQGKKGESQNPNLLKNPRKSDGAEASSSTRWQPPHQDRLASHARRYVGFCHSALTRAGSEDGDCSSARAGRQHCVCCNG